ncbi:MAG: tetratricopeptide repeat protein [Deltaproteobacteria bacterium]|nr:tetratricopeptide repeat protein [Deltaproteobacteria bacterium]
MKYKLIKYKYLIAVLIGVSVILLAFGIWTAGKQRFSMQSQLNSEDLDKTREFFEDKGSDSTPIDLYNLGSLYYQSKDYPKALEYYEQVLGMAEKSRETTQKTLYNLGNTHFRLSEATQDLNEKIEHLGKSLQYYKDTLSLQEKHDLTDSDPQGDVDAKANFILARNRFKQMMDLLKQKQQEEDKNKSFYVLIKQLIQKEESIKSKLAQLDALNNHKEKAESLKQLIEDRKDNLDQIRLLRDKLITLKNQGKPQSPKSMPPASGSVL